MNSQRIFDCGPRHIPGIALTLALAGLAGCTVGPKYHPPVTQAPAAYKEAPAPAPATAAPQTIVDTGGSGSTQSADTAQGSHDWRPASPADAQLRGDWWTIFNEPELNRLEDQLNINNQNIKVYFEDLMQARALIREARAQYFPTFGTTPSWVREKSSGNLTNSQIAHTGATTALYTLPFALTWEPDLWGRVRNLVHEAQYSAQMSAADLENERLTEQATLAGLYFEIRGQDALIQLYAQTIKADQDALSYAQSQYETGLGDKAAAVLAENTLQATQAQATNLGILRAQYEHAIAVLVGQQAERFSIAPRPMVYSPPPIPIGVPSQLLQRRPDVAAAERNMAAANAEIGFADAAFYPNLTLSAAGGTEASLAHQLLDWPSRFWSIGPSISEPIYEGGLRRATVHQYIALYNANLATYRQTVLTAFQQVEDSLSAVSILSQQIRQQRDVVATAQEGLDLEMARYRTGLDPYVNVVTLQSTLLVDQQTLASLQITQMTSAVQLIEALGGGWNVSQLPTPSQVEATPPKQDRKILR
jgi:NodT family efflux transporter outer membrane factor (OMF) lipoprotein